MAVTNNIREIREQRGIYQDDLAAAIGFSTKTVGRIERGDSTPSAEFMLRISKYFNLLVEDVFHEINWKAEQSDKKVTIAYAPMFRAVMNVIQNAVEHTKGNGIIYIDAKEQDGRLTFIVEDSGSGFTKEALLQNCCR